MAGKWLELLKEIAPRVNRVAFLFDPAMAPYCEYFLNPFKAAAAIVRNGGDSSTRSRHVRDSNPSLPHRRASRMAA